MKARYAFLLALLVALAAAGSAAAVLARHGTSTSAPATPHTAAPSVLHGVSCGSPTWCVAVGASATGGSHRGLVRQWNGSSWLAANAVAGGDDSTLQSVSCTSPAWCVAVGITGTVNQPSSRHALVVSWDGTRWSPLRTPEVTPPSVLQAVTCRSRTSCTAAGWSSTADGLPSALIESWDGSTWSVAPAGAPPDGANSWLDAVTCAGARSCVAVGSYSTTGDGDDPGARTLVEAWNGASWSVVPSPSPGTGNQSLLRAVACTSPTACIAVGVDDPRGDPYNADAQGMVEVWNGTSWSVARVDDADATTQRELQSIVCATPAGCVVVGKSTSRGDTNRELVASWNGSALSVRAASPAAGSFESVACATPARCVAVGQEAGRGATRWLQP